MTLTDPDFGSTSDFYTFAPESLAQVLPEFEIVREVGKGSMGIVYESRRRSDGLRVALKVLPPSLTLTERALARFVREGEIMSRIEHPSIVRVLDLGRQGRLHYFVMEFVDGVNLDERLKIGPIRLREAASIAAGVARALQFAHDRGIVHRDIKPSNLILRADGTIAITDFGLARETGTGSMTESGAIVGTPMFMAPEQVLGDRDEIDSRADVYGLGATLYHLVTGRPPFSGPTAQSVLKQVLDDEPRRPSRLRAELPPALEAIILQAMSKEPSQRYGTAQDMAEDLDRFLAGERVTARRIGPVARAFRSASRHPLLTTLCAIILMLAAGAYSLYSDRQTERLQTELAQAEKALAEAASRRDERMRSRGAADRESLLHRAIAHASGVIAMDAGYARAWFVRAKANHQLMNYRDAFEDLLTAEAAYGETLPEVLLYRIDAASRLPDPRARERLRADLCTLLEIDPSAHNRYLVARHLLSMAAGLPSPERAKALDTVARITGTIGDLDAGGLVVRARLRELQGDIEGAASTMREATRLFQGDLFVHAEAAALFRRCGLDEEGEAAAQRARVIDPTFTEAAAVGAAVNVGEVQGFLDELEQLLRTVNRSDRHR